MRIADFSRVLAAPYATMLLADLGAEVVKVERPDGGDETRSWGPPWSRGESTYFQAVNRNKVSRVIDLRTPGGQEEARALVADCDVVIENFRTGTMEKFGLGYDRLAATQPGLVYCSVTGFGAGAGADVPGYDLIVQAVGGLMSLTGDADSGPTKAGVALVDVISGLHATIGIQAALRHRDRTGEGQRVEVNLLSSLLSALTNQASAYVETGRGPATDGQPARRASRRTRCSRPRTGRWPSPRPTTSSSGCWSRSSADRSWRWTRASPPTAPGWSTATCSGPSSRTGCARATADEWFERLTAVGVPCGPINDLGQAVALAERLGLDPVTEIDDPDRGGTARQVSHPIRLSRTPATYRSAPPTF